MEKEKLDQAIIFIKEGNKDKALKLLASIVINDPNDELAWFWLAFSVEEDEKRSYCLKRTIAINPNNDQAINSLNKIEKKQINIAKNNDNENMKPTASLENKNKSSTVDVEEFDFYIPPNFLEHEKKDQSNSRFPKRKSNNRKKFSVQKTFKRKRGGIPVTYKPPKIIKFSLGDNFFNGFQNKLKPGSRLETGIYENNIIVDGIRLDKSDLPNCLKNDSEFDEYRCYYCEFFSGHDCLLKFDPEFAEELLLLSNIHKEKLIENEKRRKNIITTIYNELKTHGRPIHYSILCRMVVERYPKFKLNEKKVYKYIQWHPELFERIDIGVYRAK